MELETLKGTEKIGEFSVICMDKLREKFPDKFNESGAMNFEWFEKEIRPNYFVYVRHDVNSISFTLQNGGIKEVGVNGCQVDTMIEASKLIISKFNELYPSDYNDVCIEHLTLALQALKDRKSDREKRGVEGFLKK